MKILACSFLLATLLAAVPSSGRAQGGGGTADQAVSGFGIRKPTPPPSSSPAASSSAKATGPADAGLYKDAKGKSAATTFAPTDTIYVMGQNITVKKGDKVGVRWYGKGDKKLTAQEVNVPDDGVYGPTFHLSPPPKGTPAGSYRADFVQNGKVIKRLPFTVK